MKKKVCFFVTSLNSGGIENYLLRFLKHYGAQIEATVICKSGFTGDLESKYNAIGATLKPYKLGFFNPLPYLSLFLFFRKNKFHSVCDFTGNYAAIPLLVSRFSGIKQRVAFFRGSTNHFRETRTRLFYNKLMNVLLPKVSNKILSNSQAAFSFFYPKKHKRYPAKYQVIYNGIDADLFLSSKEDLREELNIPQNAFVIGHTGRYNSAKNHKTIIEVVIKLAKKYQDIYVVLCGQDVDTNLAEIVSNENLTEQIKVFGYRRDVIKVLNTLDCFYFPSITEGQPNSLIEAMLVNLPVVTSNIAPIFETIPNNLISKVSFDPLDVTSHVNALEYYYRNRNNLESFKASDYIKEKFNADSQFTLFFKNL